MKRRSLPLLPALFVCAVSCGRGGFESLAGSDGGLERDDDDDGGSDGPRKITAATTRFDGRKRSEAGVRDADVGPGMDTPDPDGGPNEPACRRAEDC